MSRNCPVCGSDALEALPFTSNQRNRAFRIHHCGECAHRFVADQPSDEELQALYTAHYARDRRYARPARPGMRDRALARRLVPLLPPNAKVLEVGANFGETLLALPASYELTGVELSETAAETAARNPRLDIRQGFFESMELPEAAYDCVVSLAVIEHVRDPGAFLGKIARHLKPGGTLVLMTGDYGSWRARTLGERWSLYHSTGHLHFFSQRSLTTALAAQYEPRDWIWAGPTPVTHRLPKPLGRALHCQTASLLAPSVLGRRRYGDIMYCWATRAAA